MVCSFHISRACFEWLVIVLSMSCLRYTAKALSACTSVCLSVWKNHSPQYHSHRSTTMRKNHSPHCHTYSSTIFVEGHSQQYHTHSSTTTRKHNSPQNIAIVAPWLGRTKKFSSNILLRLPGRGLSGEGKHLQCWLHQLLYNLIQNTGETEFDYTGPLKGMTCYIHSATQWHTVVLLPCRPCLSCSPQEWK